MTQIWIAILLLLAARVFAEDFGGRVVAISDGDTISVLLYGQAVRVRLHGIDAPEKGQPFTNRAKQFASEIAFGKEMKVEVKGKDRYKRTIGEVFLPDGRNLNHEIMRAGFAWWFRLKRKRGRRGAGCGWIRIRFRRGSSGGFQEKWLADELFSLAEFGAFG